MPRPAEIAAYFLHLAGQAEEPALLTNMHLQKLAYYAQGWSLALRGRPMFDAEIQAWVYGPVVAEMYGQLARFGRGAVDPAVASFASVSNDDRRLLDQVWERYSAYSAPRLSEMTHQEPPWIQARQGVPADAQSTSPITHESMRTFFRAEADRVGLAEAGVAVSDLEAAERDFAVGATLKHDQLRRRLRVVPS